MGTWEAAATYKTGTTNRGGEITAGAAKIHASMNDESNPENPPIETTTNPSVGCVNAKS